MRRFVLFLLLFSILFSFSFAETPFAPGVYVRSFFPNYGSEEITVYHFYPDHTVYHLSHYYSPSSFDEKDLSAQMFTWEIDGRKISIYGDLGLTNVLYYVNGSCLSEIDPDKYSGWKYAIYLRIDDSIQQTLDDLPSDP